MIKKLASLCAIIALIGCTHSGTVSTVSPTNIYSAHDTRVEGRATYTIDATSLTKLRKDDTVKGVLCGVHKYPVDGTDAFVTSVRPMLDAVFEEPTEQATDTQRGAINFLFRVERFEPRLKFNRKFFGAEGEATVEISISATGTANGKRIFGTTVDSQRSATSEAGPFCSGGEEGLHEATAAVIKDVLEKIGERITNSPQVRSAAIQARQKKK